MNIKKFLTISILVIIAMLGISTKVQAKTYYSYSPTKKYKVGDEVYITPTNKNIEDRNLLCLEAQQAMTAVTKYTVRSVINIRGTVSTDQTGKSVDNKYNAKMAYIAADKTKYKNVHYNKKQTAMWCSAREWFNQVGKFHEGLFVNFATMYSGTNDLEKEAENYMNSLSKVDLTITDNTNKEIIQKNISTVTIDNVSYTKVGPFNITFPGNLSRLEVYDQNNNVVSNIKYAMRKKGEKELEIKKIKELKTNKNFYILIPTSSYVARITNITVASDYQIKTAELTFFYTTKGDWQNLVRARGDTENESINSTFPYDIRIAGTLKVIKVVKGNENKTLPNVEFLIKNEETQKYVRREADGSITFVEGNEGPTVFVTDQDGMILVENLPIGNYTAYETRNPNYGYAVQQEGQPIAITLNGIQEVKIPNEQILIKLSGYVWEDIAANKETERNNYYNINIDGLHPDPYDKLKAGITVRLKDRRDGSIVKSAVTNENGAYEFIDVIIKELENYYIEFEYDGLTYTNVNVHLDHSNGSKAAENIGVRDQFNRQFTSIEGTGETTGVSKNENGEITHNLRYNQDKQEMISTFINDGSYKITSNTTEAGYSIKDHYIIGEERIENINLGIYSREQPDIALRQDLKNTKITINGFAHIYEYEKYLQNVGEYQEGFNVGVEFAKKNNIGGYTRAVYKSDVDFTTEDKNNELQVYVTYEIRILNQSTNLSERANTIADYYSKGYELVAIGTKLDERSNIAADSTLEHTDSVEYNDKYMKTTITTKDFVQKQKTSAIYVQFKLNREAVIDIINSEKELENIADITSYSVQDKEGKAYAGIDTDSNPGNAIPGDKTTYEDDTDYALSLKLEIADARIMQGIVFEDATDSELHTGERREEDGEYKESEDKAIGGITVTLKENKKETGLTYITTTAMEDGTYGIKESPTDNTNIKEWTLEKINDNDINSNLKYLSDAEVENSGYIVKAKLKKGEFLIPGYIPGNYVVTYTWGNEEYDIEDFKSTIYNEKDRQNQGDWYKKDVDRRYSDAIDDWEMRQKVDQENSEITTMNSNTPNMVIGIEYETTYTLSPEDGIQYGSSLGDKFIYQIKNIDFGIIERAIQRLTLDKSVKTLKVTLVNGQVLVDAKINERGKLEGQIEGVTTQPANENNLGFVKAELDKELLHGSSLEIGYEFTVKNISELDYVSEDYYKYGYEQANAAGKLGNVLKLNVKELTDYLDSTLSYDDANNETKWTGKQSDTEGKMMLATSGLSKDLAPGEQNSTTMKASKLLSNQETNIFNNEAKVTVVARTPEISTGMQYGRKPNLPEDQAEEVIISAPTGENLNYVLPITIGLSTLVLLGLGVVIIKRKVIKK